MLEAPKLLDLFTASSSAPSTGTQNEDEDFFSKCRVSKQFSLPRALSPAASTEEGLSQNPLASGPVGLPPPPESDGFPTLQGPSPHRFRCLEEMGKAEESSQLLPNCSLWLQMGFAV